MNVYWVGLEKDKADGGYLVGAASWPVALSRGSQKIQAKVKPKPADGIVVRVQLLARNMTVKHYREALEDGYTAEQITRWNT